MPQLPCPLGNAPEHLAALECGGQHGKLLILRDGPTPRGDRAVAGADRDHLRLRPPSEATRSRNGSHQLWKYAAGRVAKVLYVARTSVCALDDAGLPNVASR